MAASASASRQRVALETGIADSRAALRAWRGPRAAELAGWAAGSLAIGLLLLGGALAVALAVGPTGEHVLPVFADPRAGVSDAVRIVGRNVLVLVLHCLVCLATYLATRSLPLQARRSSGSDRLVRELGRPVALGAVTLFTLGSLGIQLWRLGHDLAGAASTLGLSPAGLVARLALHAVPELTALFLPLAACLALCRAQRHRDLGAAALATGVLALPVVVLAACCEVWVTRVLL